MNNDNAFIDALAGAASQCGSPAEPDAGRAEPAARTCEAGPAAASQAHAAACAEYRQRADALFGDRLVDGSNTNQVKNAEAPQHRLMVLLKVQGYSNREIAELTGYTDTTVSNVLRQPWARSRLVKLISEHGLVGIKRLLEGELAANILTLVAVRDDASARGSERIAAANALLDRFLGKPTTVVETTHREAPGASVEELQKQLDALKAEEQRLRAN